MFLYGNYEFAKEYNYDDAEKHIKKLYNLRGEIIHKGKLINITSEQLTTICRYSTWMILELLSLSKNGNRCFSEVEEKIKNDFNKVINHDRKSYN